MDLKELDKLMKLCRRNGVKSFTSPDWSFILGDEPSPPPRRKIEGKESKIDPFLLDSEVSEKPLSKEEEEYRALFWSSAGA